MSAQQKTTRLTWRFPQYFEDLEFIADVYNSTERISTAVTTVQDRQSTPRRLEITAMHARKRFPGTVVTT